jgi:hypothetical protein
MRNEEWQRQTEQITRTKQSGVGVKTLHRFSIPKKSVGAVKNRPSKNHIKPIR